MSTHKIEVKHITCVINRQKIKPSDYSIFIENINNAIKIYSKIVNMEEVGNRYLVIYIFPSPLDSSIMHKLKKLISTLTTDYVIIDELFPTDNSHFMNEKGHPKNASWITKQTFLPKQTLIEVE